MAVESGRVVEVERRIAAPREEVFVFLTDPDKYTEWMGEAVELDPRPGGVYRVRMNSDRVALGEYVEVDPPSRVVFTWGWEGDGAVPPGSTRVEITSTTSFRTSAFTLTSNIRLPRETAR